MSQTFEMPTAGLAAVNTIAKSMLVLDLLHDFPSMEARVVFQTVQDEIDEIIESKGDTALDYSVALLCYIRDRAAATLRDALAEREGDRS